MLYTMVLDKFSELSANELWSVIANQSCGKTVSAKYGFQLANYDYGGELRMCTASGNLIAIST